MGLARALLCCLGLLALAPAAALAAPMTPRSAAAFRDSVGVNTHAVYFDTAYADWERIVARLDELGVDHLRDAAHGNPDPSWRDWNERYFRAVELAAAHGKRFTLLMGRPGYATGSIEDLVGVVGGRLRHAIVALEAPNEYDLVSGVPDWPAPLRSYVEELHTRVRAHPGARDLPIAGPSLVFRDSRARLGSLGDLVDLGNLHPYSGGERPSAAQIADEIELMRLVTGDRDIVATEAGFHNAMNATDGHPPVPEDVAAAYTLRTLLEHFRAGVRRTFLYELIDEKADPGLVDPEQHFGLLRHDGTPKPAFTALKNLLAVVGRPAAAGAARPVDIEIGGDTAGVRHLLLQAPEGRHLLVLWQDESLWDTATRTRRAVAPREVRLRLPAAAATLSRPAESGRREAVAATGGAATVAVPADPVVVEFSTGTADSLGTGGDRSSPSAPTGPDSACDCSGRATATPPQALPATRGSVRVGVCTTRRTTVRAWIGKRRDRARDRRGAFRPLRRAAAVRRSRCVVRVRLPRGAAAARATGLRVRVAYRRGHRAPWRFAERPVPAGALRR